jgi:hypothetical protein
VSKMMDLDTTDFLALSPPPYQPRRRSRDLAGRENRLLKCQFHPKFSPKSAQRLLVL